MHKLHTSYMFNTLEVTNEYNILNDFLSNSLLDGAGLASTEDDQNSLLTSKTETLETVVGDGTNQRREHLQPTPTPSGSTPLPVSGVRRASNVLASDKAQETYYLTAADPSGNEAPDERIKVLLDAKYKAGLLRPFNYVKGYARLQRYMDQHMKPHSRQKILRQLDSFRPKFRERMQSLTDGQLVIVEMWFERCLMEYDRVFASMAVPACCWRRTGEIFRGNKEMAELIHVPIEDLRDVSRTAVRNAHWLTTCRESWLFTSS